MDYITKGSTLKQRMAVNFCCQMLDVDFNGNINAFKDCSSFLSVYLEEAKQFATELKCEYDSYIESLD